MKRIVIIINIISVFFVFPVVMNVSAYALCVKRADVNLRAGPGTKYEKVGEVFKYTPLKKVKKQGKWFRVSDLDGVLFWINRNLVTEKFRCAVVKEGEVRIRSGPGTKFREIDHSPTIKYETFKVIRIKGSWIKVEDEFGGTGWIYRKYLWIQ